jgi:hypothetical protein
MEHVVHFVTSALEIASALLVIAAIVWALRRAGWRGPTDIAGLVENWFGIATTDTDSRLLLNVEYRDATSVIMDLGPLVTATLQNGRGRTFDLQEGVFVGCHPLVIKAGASVQVAVQGGLVRECLLVQLDLHRQVLFVKSQFTLSEVVSKINVGPVTPESPDLTFREETLSDR